MKIAKNILISIGITLLTLLGLTFIVSKVLEDDNDYIGAFMNDHGYTD